MRYEFHERITTSSTRRSRIALFYAACIGLSSFGCHAPSASRSAHPVHELPPLSESDQDVRAPGWSLQTGAGFTASPDMLLLPLAFETEVARDVMLGPSVQIGLSDDTTFLAPGAEARWVLSRGSPSGSFLDRLSPYVTGGLGLAWLEKDRRRGDDDDFGLLVDVGFGAEVHLDENVSLGTRVVFDWLPGGLVGEHTIVTWQVLTVRVRL